MVGMEVHVEVDNIGGGSEVMHFTLGTLVKFWRVRGTVDDDVGVSAGLTTT